MDFDVFGGPSESSVVVLGADNVVIVKNKDAEQASNEEIPQAIAELKLEATDTPESAAEQQDDVKAEVKAEVKEETPTKKSRKREAPAKDETIDMDALRPLRSSRSKVVNYFAPQQEIDAEIAKIPKVTKPRVSKKKELEAGREAAIQAGFNLEKMSPLELRELPEFAGEQEKARYLEIRNSILKHWHANPSEQLTKAHVLEHINAKLRNSIDHVFDFLERFGHINFGRFKRIEANTSESNQSAEMANARKKTIIIVGAGMAGLAAARQLDYLGYKVILLEGRNRVGGRVYTSEEFNGCIDLGGSIITGLEGNPITVIVQQLGVKLHPLGHACPIYNIDGTPVDSELDSKVEKLFNSTLDQAAKFKIDERKNLPSGCGKSLGRTFDYLVSQENPPLTASEKQLLDWHCANLEYGCAAHLDLVALHEWDQDDQYEFHGEHCMLEKGYSSLANGLTDGLDLRKESLVTDIRYVNPATASSTTPAENSTNASVQVTLSDGSTIEGDSVLVTVPLGVLKKNVIKFQPALPDWKSAVINRLGFGLLNKVVMLFPHVFWDAEADYFGMVNDTQETRGEGYLFWNLQRIMGAPVLVSLVAGEASFVPAGDDSVIDRVLKKLTALFGNVPTPIKTHLTRWHEDPLATGSYSYIGMGSSGADYDIESRSFS